MKILFLNGSPRINGNTSILLKTIAKGFTENKSDNDFEIIDVAYKNIKGCMACNACAKSGRCVHKDDTNEIIQKMDESDMVVFGTPVYWWGMSAQLKLAVDKLYCNSKVIQKKKVAIVAVGASPVDNPQYALISGQFKCIFDYLKSDMVFEKFVYADKAGEVANDENLMQEFFDIGKNL